MDNTIIQQGSFTSTAAAVFIPLRSSCDWFRTYNYTQIGTSPNPKAGYEFYWQRGLADGYAFEYYNTAGSNVLELTKITTGGFTYIDTSASPNGLLQTNITAISALATPPVCTTAAPHGLSTGDIVRLTHLTAAEQLGGIDYHITRVDGSNFSLTYMPQIAVAGTAGYYRKIKWDPIFYPRTRYISQITQATSAVVTFTVPHGYTVGQEIRFSIPNAYGMVELSEQVGTITAITTSTVTVNIDTTTYTAFAFPTPALLPFSPAIAAPLGESLTVTHNLDDATDNQAQIGMYLAAGIDSPAGQNNDVIYWVAGKSFNL